MAKSERLREIKIENLFAQSPRREIDKETKATAIAKFYDFLNLTFLFHISKILTNFCAHNSLSVFLIQIISLTKANDF